MPLPLPELDDRRFEDLLAEARQRLPGHVPEWTNPQDGDPGMALVELFAWLTETVIYRANLIPERQRRAFLNLLQIPLRPARPARGLVCIDAAPRSELPALLPPESALRAGETVFSTDGELQPTPMELSVLVKRRMSNSDLQQAGVTRHQLREQYGVDADPFRPHTLVPGRDLLSLEGSQDEAFHLALSLPARLAPDMDALRRLLAGRTLNIGLAPADELDAELAGTPRNRQLRWDLAWQDPDTDTLHYLPLELVDDSSGGGRRPGVARLRLPRDPRFITAVLADDPQYAGLGDAPPEPPADVAPERLVCWLRLRCPEEPRLTLGYLGVNAVEVLGQGVARDQLLATGSGRPDQVVALPHGQLDATSLVLEVEGQGRFEPWTQVEHFAAAGPDDAVYRLDPAEGQVRFGDGTRGRRPPAGKRIRAAVYRHGGGSAGNLPAGAIRELHGGSSRLRVRHEWPTRGGVDTETVAEAERRIPAFLGHRERAVTAEDFALLARDNPVNPVARAEVVAGFLPGSSLTTVRWNVPGAVSVFVMPPAAAGLANAPRPSAGLLRDVHAYLTPRMPVATELYVLSPQYLPVALSVAVEVTDPAAEQTTLRAVERALLDYLWALPPGGPAGGGWPLGRALEINELRTRAGRVPGVLAVNGLRLFYQDLDSGTWQELREAQDLPLADYQLPELTSVSAQPGEDRPEPPPGREPGQPGGPRGVAVPVIPELC